MILFFKLQLRSVIKYKLLIGIIVLLSACSSMVKVDNPQGRAELEKLSNQLAISIPVVYEGVGFSNSEDASGFKKQKKGGKLRFSFENMEGMGIRPNSYASDTLPKILKALPKRIKLGEDVVYFYNDDNGMSDLNSNGVVYFLFDGMYKEVLYVNYQSQLQSEVERILKTITLSSTN
ncbi:MAG: hypothetical protein ACJA0Q_000323 [Saprospiraceae bacterium]|jgi:hypothetical protein